MFRRHCSDDGGRVEKFLERDDLAVAQCEHMRPVEVESRIVRPHADRFAAEHDNAVAYDFPMFSIPVESAQVVAAL